MHVPRVKQRGQIPLWFMVVLAAAALVAAVWWTRAQTRVRTADGRETIVFWGHGHLGEDMETLLHRFEQEYPQYRVVMSKAAARDLTGDAQRLMSAIAGGVPPDVVFFDRFAIGEWASRGALLDLRPMLEAQPPDEPYRINLEDYYDFTVAEASYKPPGTEGEPGIYGIPESTDIRLLFINSDALRQAGLVDERGNPRPPKDWDELRDYALKLTLYRTPGDKTSGITRLGFAPASGNSWLYMYMWQAGGEFLNSEPIVETLPDGTERVWPPLTKLTMNSPPVVRALRYMTEMYDALGGIGQVKSFEESQQGGVLDPFLLGRLAMKIDSNDVMRTVADWKPDLDFMVVPAPMPADQVALGRHPVAWSGGFSLVIPATARQKEGAFRLIQYIRSEAGVELIERGRREQREAEGRLYLPRTEANRVFFERFSREAVDDNPDAPETFRRGYAAMRQMLPHTKIRPVTPVGQMLWTQHVRAFDAAARHQFAEQARRAGMDEYEYVLDRMQRPVQERLDELLAPPPPRVVNWTPWIFGYLALVSVPFVLLAMVYRRRRREYGYRAREVGAAMLFLSPWVIGFVALVGGPILFSIVFSFTRYDVLSAARYVGTENYSAVLRDPVFYISLLNTAYMVLAIPLGMAVSLAIALLLDRGIRGIGLYRAGFYLPAIMPLVASSLLWIWILNPSYGLINTFLGWLYDTWVFDAIEQLIGRITGSPFIFPLPLWLQDAAWSKPSLILMKLWAAGGGMIIWLAGLQSIPDQLYEAARVDGANAWQRFRNVTLPMLSPYVLFNLIIGLIGTMQIFAESYIMTEGGPADSTLFYAYYLFKQAFQYFNMGYASALAWILFVIVLVLTLAQLWLSKRWVHYERS